jgi:hypothetical protein
MWWKYHGASLCLQGNHILLAGLERAGEMRQKEAKNTRVPERRGVVPIASGGTGADMALPVFSIAILGISYRKKVEEQSHQGCCESQITTPFFTSVFPAVFSRPLPRCHPCADRPH